MKNITKNIIASLVIMLLVACASPAPAETPAPETGVTSVKEVIAEGRLEPVHASNLTFQVRGVVEQVLVETGDSVKEGDVLARLSNSGAAEAQLLIAQNNFDTLLRNEGGTRAQLWQAYMDAQIARGKAEKKWEDLNVDNIEDNIEDDKATIEDRQQDLKDAQEDFDKYKNLDIDNSKRKQAEDDLENAQEDLNQELRDLESRIRERDAVKAAYESALGLESEAKHQYEISLDGPNTEQLALAKANLEAAQDALSGYLITAPFNGVIAEVNVKIGEQVTAETRAVSVVDFSSWLVETTDVNELEVVKLRIGQKVLMTPDALPDVQLKGVITEISNSYTQQGGDILYLVRVSVTNPSENLRWGMTVEAVFGE